MTNPFAFLQAEWPDVYESATKAAGPLTGADLAELERMPRAKTGAGSDGFDLL